MVLVKSNFSERPWQRKWSLQKQKQKQTNKQTNAQRLKEKLNKGNCPVIWLPFFQVTFCRSDFVLQRGKQEGRKKRYSASVTTLAWLYFGVTSARRGAYWNTAQPQWRKLLFPVTPPAPKTSHIGLLILLEIIPAGKAARKSSLLPWFLPLLLFILCKKIWSSVHSGDLTSVL